ncbi:MAG: radical SAM protein [Candidatus Omnitrophica bacterium]|nr:radical SAM protein [Candidatus Omnitrophota bacterium]MBU1996063.1 radical SAM protein [Candidatus Omnitrophota bacterium]MBU4332935.1 radical SAM protein [Candidatus Omnitrophota bacterium]
MNIKTFAEISSSVVLAKLFNIKRPLAIRWALTYQCNQKCLYCGIPFKETFEIDTNTICKMIDNFASLGTKWISFSGGEPLLKNGLCKILKQAKSHNIFVSVSTNGALIPENLEAVKFADRIKLSLDGPEEINDPIKGKGVFKQTLAAIDLCRINKIPVSIDCVLSKFNLDSIDYLLNLAVEKCFKISFLPSSIRNPDRQNAGDFLPETIEYRKAIKHLIYQKKQGKPVINSIPALNHIYHWPEYRKIPCSMGLLSFNVEPNGVMGACIDKSYTCTEEDKTLNVNKIKEYLETIKVPVGCQECWCSAIIEFNLITSFNINAIINYLRNS